MRTNLKLWLRSRWHKIIMLEFRAHWRDELTQALHPEFGWFWDDDQDGGKLCAQLTALQMENMELKANLKRVPEEETVVQSPGTIRMKKMTIDHEPGAYYGTEKSALYFVVFPYGRDGQKPHIGTGGYHATPEEAIDSEIEEAQ